MEPVILTWRPQNFLTILAMILVIGAVTAVVAQVLQRAVGGGSSTKGTNTNPQGQ